MKKILLVHPNNFLNGGQGENNRVKQLVDMLIEIGYEVDLFSFENFSTDSSFNNFEEVNKEKKINRLFIYDFQKGYGIDVNQKQSFFSRAKKKFFNGVIIKEGNERYLQDWVRPGMKQMFDEIVQSNEYDVVATFYTYLANLFQGITIKGKKVYFMEDSVFLQQYSWDSHKPGITLGKLMDEEIELLKVFDEFFCISYDEKIFYEKITGYSMNFLPYLMGEEVKKVKTPLSQRKWDVFFIGFNNPFNVEGIKWFLNDVYPFLDNNIRILLVGSATKSIDVTYSNVDIIPFAPDLDEIFENVKVSICPMFRGTGMKVKVIESMSKGLPIVCNIRGVDGFPDKTISGCLVTQDPKEFAEYINRLISDEKYYSEVVDNINMYYSKVFNKKEYIELLEKKL